MFRPLTRTARRPVAILSAGLLTASMLLGATTSASAAPLAPHWGNYQWFDGQEKASTRAFWLFDRTGDPTMNAIINYVANAWNGARAENNGLPYVAVYVDKANVGKCFVNQAAGNSSASACMMPGLSKFGIKGISATQGSPHFFGGAFAVTDGLGFEEAFTVVCHNMGRLIGLPVSADSASCMHPDSTPGVLKWYGVDDGTAVLALYAHDDGQAPVAVADAFTTNEDVALTPGAPGLLANDSDGEGDALTATKVTDPTNGIVAVNANGSFSYTPNADFNGTDSFTYKAVGAGTDSNVATATITVTPVADAPVAVADTYSTGQDAALTVAAAGVLGNDTDADGSTLTALKVSDPTNGVVTVNADGSFVYTPNATFNGSDSFTYKANDATADSNVATVSITVTAPAVPPVAVADTFTTTKNVALVVGAPGLLANDTTTSGTLTASKVSNPTNGTVTVNANGSFVYTPTPSYTGPDSFTYEASNGTAGSNVATVTITVAR